MKWLPCPFIIDACRIVSPLEEEEEQPNGRLKEKLTLRKQTYQIS